MPSVFQRAFIPSWLRQAPSGGLPGRLEEANQLLGHGLGCDHRGEMAGARQLADVQVGDVLGDVPCRIGEPGAEQGLPATQEQDRRGNRPEHLGVGRPGPL